MHMLSQKLREDYRLHGFRVKYQKIFQGTLDQTFKLLNRLYFLRYPRFGDFVMAFYPNQVIAAAFTIVLNFQKEINYLEILYPFFCTSVLPTAIYGHQQAMVIHVLRY